MAQSMTYRELKRAIEALDEETLNCTVKLAIINERLNDPHAGEMNIVKIQPFMLPGKQVDIYGVDDEVYLVGQLAKEMLDELEWDE